MEATGENGDSFSVDLNENEEELEEGGGVRAGPNAGVALKAGVGGGPEAGKGHIYMTGNGRNVNTDGPVQPLPLDPELVLEVSAEVEEFLPRRLADSCAVTTVCGDHSGLNGFSESVGREEPVTVGLGGAADIHGRISVDTGGHMRQEPAGGSAVNTSDSAEDEEAPDGCVRTSVSAEPPWTVEHQMNHGTLPCPDVNMPNGDISSPGSAVVHLNPQVCGPQRPLYPPRVCKNMYGRMSKINVMFIFHSFTFSHFINLS